MPHTASNYHVIINYTTVMSMYNSMISAHIFFKQVFLKLTLDKKHHSTID